MLKQLALVSAVILGTVAAHATTISGDFTAVGSDTFTSSTITFGNSYVLGSINGDFATYLGQMTPINFLGGALPYTQGQNNSAPNVPLFSITNNGETFTFLMSNYSATYFTNADSCDGGSICLDATGMGFFTGSGALNGQSGPATFTFTSQYAPDVNIANFTSFSASASAPAPAPEPASLALVGSGLLAAVAFARRRHTA
jgi:hypothetical protein